MHILLATFMLPATISFAIDEVLNVIEDEHVDHVIVGLPLQMDGTEGKSAKKDAQVGGQSGEEAASRE